MNTKIADNQSYQLDSQTDNEIDSITILTEYDIFDARTKAREIARKIGFRYMDQTRISTAVSELARNALQFAGKGIVTIKELNNKRGIEINIEDEGPGIENLDLVLKGGYSTIGGLGLGVSGSKKLMDYFDIETNPGKGTKIIIKKWLND